MHGSSVLCIEHLRPFCAEPGADLSLGDFETLKVRLESCNAFSDDEGTILRF